MLHFYFFKYWSRGLVGLMIFFVVGYFGLFTFSLFAISNQQQQSMSESAMLSVTPQLQQTLLNSPQTQNTYKKSVQLFGEIQKLKENNQDTTKLETLYADSVKDLTNQHTKDAENKLQTIETVIAGINLTLSVTPSLVPSGTEETTITPAPSGAIPSGAVDTFIASDSAEPN